MGVGVDGSGSPTVSMRLGDDRTSEKKQVQFNEALNQAKSDDDDASSPETAPQRKAIGGSPTTQSLVDSGPRQFTDKQIYGETDAASKRIDAQIAEDRRNSLQPATRPAVSVFPEPGRDKGWAVHAESPPRLGGGVGTCNVSADELNRRGIIRDSTGTGMFDLRLVRSGDTGLVRVEPLFSYAPRYYDAPDAGLFDIKNQKLPPTINGNGAPGMSPFGQSSYESIRPGSSSWFPPPTPSVGDEFIAKCESVKAGVGANAPLLMVAVVAGGNTQAMIEQSAPANGVLSAIGGTYQAAAAQPTLTPSRPTVSTTISSLEADAATSPRPTTTDTTKTSSANLSAQTPALVPEPAKPSAEPLTISPKAVPPTIPSQRPGYLSDQALISRSTELSREVATRYLTANGKAATEAAIEREQQRFTVGVLQGHKDGKLVTTAAVQDPKYAPYLRASLKPSETLVEPFQVPQQGKRVEELKNNPANVHSEQVLADNAKNNGLISSRVATSHPGCKDACIPALKEYYPGVRHVNPQQ